jgi:hypothetical protein
VDGRHLLFEVATVVNGKAVVDEGVVDSAVEPNALFFDQLVPEFVDRK